MSHSFTPPTAHTKAVCVTRRLERATLEAFARLRLCGERVSKSDVPHRYAQHSPNSRAPSLDSHTPGQTLTHAAYHSPAPSRPLHCKHALREGAPALRASPADASTPQHERCVVAAGRACSAGNIVLHPRPCCSPPRLSPPPPSLDNLTSRWSRTPACAHAPARRCA